MDNNKKEFYVENYDFNAKKIYMFNIFDHWKFSEDVEKLNDEDALLEIVEKIARDQYKMVKPNETIYIDKNKNDNKLIQGIGSENDLLN